MQHRRRRYSAMVLVGLVGFVVAGGSLSVRAVVADEEFAPSVPGQYIVVLKPEGDPQSVATAAGAVLESDPLLAADRTYLLSFSPNVDVAATLSALANTPGVATAQPNVLSQTADFLGLRKRFFADLDGPVPVSTASSYALSQPGLASANPTGGLSGAGQVIAVLDTGLDATHPLFAQRSVGGADLVDNDDNPAEATNGLDDNGNGTIDEAFGHGTFVAGLASLVAPDAAILPVRVLDTDGTTNAWTLARGLAYARQQGADVINLSLGGPNLGVAVADQLQAAHDAGILLVAAAGNEASSVERYPAAYANVVAVGAVNGVNGEPATFSNRGSWVDVAAPGVELISTFPGGAYARWGGTSASTALVAGLLAGLRQLHPAAAVTQITDWVTASSNQTTISISAYGIVDMTEAFGRAEAEVGGPQDGDND